MSRGGESFFHAIQSQADVKAIFEKKCEYISNTIRVDVCMYNVALYSVRYTSLKIFPNSIKIFHSEVCTLYLFFFSTFIVAATIALSYSVLTLSDVSQSEIENQFLLLSGDG